jgi:hypothetical protein
MSQQHLLVSGWGYGQLMCWFRENTQVCTNAHDHVHSKCVIKWLLSIPTGDPPLLLLTSAPLGASACAGLREKRSVRPPSGLLAPAERGLQQSNHSNIRTSVTIF